eukprot:scaffold49254_cov52-Attheya_sp.AAC.4
MAVAWSVFGAALENGANETELECPLVTAVAEAHPSLNRSALDAVARGVGPKLGAVFKVKQSVAPSPTLQRHRGPQRIFIFCRTCRT